jgi:hypothetical protein
MDLGTRHGRSHGAPTVLRAAPSAPGGNGPTGPGITASLADGPLRGRSIEAQVVEGRAPSTVDVPADDGTTCRYCLAEWEQSGPSADYTFLYVV